MVVDCTANVVVKMKLGNAFKKCERRLQIAGGILFI